MIVIIANVLSIGVINFDNIDTNRAEENLMSNNYRNFMNSRNVLGFKEFDKLGLKSSKLENTYQKKILIDNRPRLYNKNLQNSNELQHTYLISILASNKVFKSVKKRRDKGFIYKRNYSFEGGFLSNETNSNLKTRQIRSYSEENTGEEEKIHSTNDFSNLLLKAIENFSENSDVDKKYVAIRKAMHSGKKIFKSDTKNNKADFFKFMNLLCIFSIHNTLIVNLKKFEDGLSIILDYQYTKTDEMEEDEIERLFEELNKVALCNLEYKFYTKIPKICKRYQNKSLDEIIKNSSRKTKSIIAKLKSIKIVSKASKVTNFILFFRKNVKDRRKFFNKKDN